MQKQIEEIKKDVEKMEDLVLSLKEKVNLLFSLVSGEKLEVTEKKVYFCPSCGFSATSNVNLNGSSCWICNQDKFKKIEDYEKAQDFIDNLN